MNQRKNIYALLLLAALGGVLLSVHSCGRSGDPSGRKVVLIAGKPSHGEGCHDWPQDARILKQALDNAVRQGQIEPLRIDIEKNGWPDDPSVLDDADAIVFLTDGSANHPLKEPQRATKIRELAKRGVGLAFIHYAVEPPKGGEAELLQLIGGSYEPGYSQNPWNTVAVSPVNNGHPICRGCSSYVVKDEWYFDIRLRANDPRVVPVLTGKLPPWAPKDKVLAWAFTRDDGGRGFGFVGGHYDRNWRIEPFRKMILNAILWIAKAEVPKNGVEPIQPWRFVSIPDFINVDLTYPQPGWEKTLDYVLNAIKAEKPAFVLVAGDLVMGRWPDKESIKKYAAVYYPAWVKRMQDHGLEFYTAIGDHDIGDNPWPQQKAALVPYFKRQFQRYLNMPLDGPLRMKGTAFWFVYEDALFIAVDVFEKGHGPQGGIVCKVSGPQLKWLEQVIDENPGVRHVIVMGHTPILGPVAKESSSGLMLEGGEQSPLWQTLKKHGVSLYLCGEVHAITCTQADGVLQIAHGGLFGYNPKVNYLVATVYPDRIELQLKELSILNEGGRLWQVGTNRPHERVSISDAVKQRGFVTVGTATLKTEGGSRVLTDATGCFK
jgi:type 1 glutamine amidotransferase